MCTSVTTVVDAKDPLTLCVGASLASTSLFQSFCATSPKPPKTDYRGESSIKMVHTIVLGLARVHPNTTKQLVPPGYPVPTNVSGVDG